MPAPTIYRSTDANAPVLFGGGGALITLLDAILVNGYGSAFASGTITSDGTNVAAGDTVTVGSQTYTFQSTIGSTANNVLIGASAAASLQNLANAINLNGTSGTTYPAGTLPPVEAWVSAITSTVLTITARRGGTAGNSIALARASGGTAHLTVSGSTLSGGSGTDSKASLGWSKPYTGASWLQADYKQLAGCGFYLQVDDTGPGSGGVRESRGFGFETLTAYNTGTGQFPTAAQSGAGVAVRKSSTLDNVARPWVLLGDDRTFYLFTYTGDSAGFAHGAAFGDFYSFVSGDLYKCLLMTGSTEGTSATSTAFGQIHQAISGANLTSHWLPRNYGGAGGSTAFIKLGDGGLVPFSSTTSALAMNGVVGFPNPADGGLYVAPLRMMDGSSPGTSLSGTFDLRGRCRGLYHLPHADGSFADGDSFSGAGDYASRNFQVVKIVGSTHVAVETTAWDTST